MFYGMINQCEISRSINAIMATVIKITILFTTVKFTTNDVMDWEFIITNLFTKTAKKNWVSPAIIKKNVFVVVLLTPKPINVFFYLHDDRW